jgi:protein-L-isoaspartate(D-aspartate) O-methyltransferase
MNLEDNFRHQGLRRNLVLQLESKGIKDKRVLAAIGKIPRHVFFENALVSHAYQDKAFPIGEGQTISQPYVHARAVEQLMLTGREKVLEIGTGSAYQTALLAQLAAQVFSVERYRDLLDRARGMLQQANARNVSLSLGDGTLGWREYAPYDGIVVSAGAPHVPPALEEQLAEGGRLLIPIGDKDDQMLTLYIKRGGQLERRDITPVRFVPLIGAQGWPG